MELVIKGIGSLVGSTIFGRRIQRLEVKERFGPSSKSYFFIVEGKPGPVDAVRDYDSQLEVVLGKFPKNGAYELFVMGWHGITCVQLHKSEIENKDVFISYFEDVLYKLKQYSDNEAKAKGL